jgi:hypothetical protein
VWGIFLHIMLRDFEIHRRKDSTSRVRIHSLWLFKPESLHHGSCKLKKNEIRKQRALLSDLFNYV